MSRVARTARAERDLVDIWLYIVKRDLSAADKMVDAIDAACERLGRHPGLGPARPDLADGLRYFVIRAYLILYRETRTGVEVVRVVHGARDLLDLP